MINVDLKIEITKRGLLEEGSLNYLFDLYLPLIGKDSAFLYMFLMNSIKTNRIFSTTNELINKCEMSLQDFLFAKKTLESIGLLSFYEKNDSSSYLYILNDVETPKNFFNNLVLKGLFIETVGEERFFEIISKYETKVNEEDYVNQSAKIQDSFQVIFDVKALDMNNGDKLLGRSKNNIKDNFSDIKLLNYLKKKGIRVAVVSNISFSGKTVQRVLDEIMPDNGIETVFSSSDYVFRKPDKIFFDIVMAQLGIQAENTWICGDNIANDVQGGLNAGLKTVYYCTDPSKRLDDERVTTITALTDLIDMIESADGVRRDENEKAT